MRTPEGYFASSVQSWNSMLNEKDILGRKKNCIVHKSDGQTNESVSHRQLFSHFTIVIFTTHWVIFYFAGSYMRVEEPCVLLRRVLNTGPD